MHRLLKHPPSKAKPEQIKFLLKRALPTLAGSVRPKGDDGVKLGIFMETAGIIGEIELIREGLKHCAPLRRNRRDVMIFLLSRAAEGAKSAANHDLLNQLHAMMEEISPRRVAVEDPFIFDNLDHLSREDCLEYISNSSYQCLPDMYERLIIISLERGEVDRGEQEAWTMYKAHCIVQDCHGCIMFWPAFLRSLYRLEKSGSVSAKRAIRHFWATSRPKDVFRDASLLARKFNDLEMLGVAMKSLKPLLKKNPTFLLREPTTSINNLFIASARLGREREICQLTCPRKTSNGYADLTFQQCLAGNEVAMRRYWDLLRTTALPTTSNEQRKLLDKIAYLGRILSAYGKLSWAWKCYKLAQSIGQETAENEALLRYNKYLLIDLAMHRYQPAVKLLRQVWPLAIAEKYPNTDPVVCGVIIGSRDAWNDLVQLLEQDSSDRHCLYIASTLAQSLFRDPFAYHA